MMNPFSKLLGFFRKSDKTDNEDIKENGRDKKDRKGKYVLTALACILISSVVIWGNISSTSAWPGDDDASGGDKNYSFYKVSSAAATYFNEALSPEGKGLKKEWVYYTGGPGDLLGFTDSDMSKGVIGWLTSKLSSSSITYSYKSLTNKAMESGTGKSNGIQAYAYFGASMRALGLDDTATESGVGLIRMGIGGLVYIVYILAISVDALFGVIIKILKTLNPFSFFIKGAQSLLPGQLNMGNSHGGALGQFADLVSSFYIQSQNIGLVFIVPVTFAFLLLYLVLGKGSSSDGGKFGKIKTFLKRFIFIVVGVPLLGSLYTGTLDLMDKVTSNTFGASQVICSTFVNFEKWASTSNFNTDGITLSWNASEGAPNPSAYTQLRRSALKMNGMNYSSDLPSGDSAFSSDILTKGNTGADSTIAAFGLLNKYMSGDFYHASDFESSWKSKHSGNNESRKKAFNFLGDQGNYKDINPQKYPELLQGEISYGGSEIKVKKLSPIAIYNYLSSDFGKDNLVVFSNEKASSGYVRKSHRSVSIIGTGIMSLLYYMNALFLLLAFAIIGWFYAIGMLISNIRRTGHMIMAIPLSVMGFFPAIAKVLTYTIVMIVEVVANIMLYLFVQSLLFSLTGIIETPITEAFSSLTTSPNFIRFIGGPQLAGVMGDYILPILTLLLSCFLYVAFLRMALKLRVSIIRGIEESVLSVAQKFFPTSSYQQSFGAGDTKLGQMASGAADGFVKGAAMGVAGGAIMGAAGLMGKMGKDGEDGEKKNVGTGDDSSSRASTNSADHERDNTFTIFDEDGNVVGHGTYNEYEGDDGMDRTDASDKKLGRETLEANSLEESYNMDDQKRLTGRSKHNSKALIRGKDGVLRDEYGEAVGGSEIRQVKYLDDAIDDETYEKHHGKNGQVEIKGADEQRKLVPGDVVYVDADGREQKVSRGRDGKLYTTDEEGNVRRVDVKPGEEVYTIVEDRDGNLAAVDSSGRIKKIDINDTVEEDRHTNRVGGITLPTKNVEAENEVDRVDNKRMTNVYDQNEINRQQMNKYNSSQGLSKGVNPSSDLNPDYTIDRYGNVVPNVKGITPVNNANGRISNVKGLSQDVRGPQVTGDNRMDTAQNGQVDGVGRNNPNIKGVGATQNVNNPYAQARGQKIPVPAGLSTSTRLDDDTRPIQDDKKSQKGPSASNENVHNRIHVDDTYDYKQGSIPHGQAQGIRKTVTSNMDIRDNVSGSSANSTTVRTPHGDVNSMNISSVQGSTRIASSTTATHETIHIAGNEAARGVAASAAMGAAVGAGSTIINNTNTTTTTAANTTTSHQSNNTVVNAGSSPAKAVSDSKDGRVNVVASKEGGRTIVNNSSGVARVTATSQGERHNGNSMKTISQNPNAKQNVVVNANVKVKEKPDRNVVNVPLTRGTVSNVSNSSVVNNTNTASSVNNVNNSSVRGGVSNANSNLAPRVSSGVAKVTVDTKQTGNGGFAGRQTVTVKNAPQGNAMRGANTSRQERVVERERTVVTNNNNSSRVVTNTTKVNNNNSNRVVTNTTNRVTNNSSGNAGSALHSKIASAVNASVKGAAENVQRVTNTGTSISSSINSSTSSSQASKPQIRIKKKTNDEGGYFKTK